MGIDRAIDAGGHPNLIRIRRELWKDYDDILRQEELLWYQKSRCRWLNWGDRNTKFFHATTIARRKRNRIEMLKDANGDWISDDERLKDMAVEFYEDLYRDDHMANHVELNNLFPSLDETSIRDIHLDLQDWEIKSALFSMGPLKAPGVDGLHALFFQSQWDTVGNDVCNLVRRAFLDPTSIKDINQTLLVLIPKVDHPESLKEFRPIALCNVVYKLITKVIANRLKGHLNKIISSAQCSFIPGRHSSDNIVVAKEVIHTMRNLRGSKSFMATKIDLEKAYDRLNWDFLQETLKDIGLKDWLINLIMACVSSCSMQVLWNGNMTRSFSTSRGVRHGDPLSPYLFVICIERLAHMITVEIEQGRWKPVRLNRSGPHISHLFFADD